MTDTLPVASDDFLQKEPSWLLQCMLTQRPVEMICLTEMSSSNATNLC